MYFVLPLTTFDRDFERLPKEIQERVGKILLLLVANTKHPSLHFKKMTGVGDFWEIRVTHDYRITCKIEMNSVYLRHVGTHDILRRP